MEIDFSTDRYYDTITKINFFFHILMALFSLERDPSLLFSFCCTTSGSCSALGNLALKINCRSSILNLEMISLTSTYQDKLL